MLKKILVVGAGGYIGSKLVESLLADGANIIALDRFFFGDTLKDLRKNKNLKIIKDDIRYFNPQIIKDIDTVINLAAISNDPASELKPYLTQEINYWGALRLAQISKEHKVKKLIFLSSCSVYGAGSGELNEQSPTNPISEYAKSKIAAERDLLSMASGDFCVTILRLATIFGLSKRMRFDLIVNIMTLHAFKKNKIFILGGGKQWRPVIHISDALKAIKILINENNLDKINNQIFNVGSNKLNFQVKDIVKKFKKYFPKLTLEIVPEDPDQRSYKVNFDKIKKVLNFTVDKKVEDGIIEIKGALEKKLVTDGITTSTLRFYQHLLDSNKI